MLLPNGPAGQAALSWGVKTATALLLPEPPLWIGGRVRPPTDDPLRVPGVRGMGEPSRGAADAGLTRFGPLKLVDAPLPSTGLSPGSRANLSPWAALSNASSPCPKLTLCRTLGRVASPIYLNVLLDRSDGLPRPRGWAEAGLLEVQAGTSFCKGSKS